MTPISRATITSSESDLREGDQLARNGDWIGAVGKWAFALDGVDQVQASSRLHWFLKQTNGNAEPTLPSWRHRLPEPFLTGVAAACIGTAAVIFAESLSSPWNHLLAVLAWSLFALSAICGLLYARRHGPVRQSMLTPDRLALAHKRAQVISAGSATIDDGNSHRA